MGKVYRTVIRPVLLYGSECWTLRASDSRAVQTAEMKMLRWSCGHTRLDKVRNDEIRMKMGVAPIEEKLIGQRLRWFGHVARRDGQHICRQIQDLEVDGTRRVGRPAKRWRDCIDEDMEARGVTADDALDRKLWRDATQIADPKRLG